MTTNYENLYEEIFLKIKENDKGVHYPTNPANLKTKYPITYKN